MDDGPTKVRLGSIFLASLVAFLFLVEEEDLVADDLEEAPKEEAPVVAGGVFFEKNVSIGRPAAEEEGLEEVELFVPRLGLVFLAVVVVVVVAVVVAGVSLGLDCGTVVVVPVVLSSLTASVWELR